MTVINVSLDLETWGTEPGCDIRFIGACVFDPVSGQVFETHEGHEAVFYTATDNPRGYWVRSPERFFTTGKPTDKLKYRLTRDPRTVQWWSEQSDEAQAAFADPVDLQFALTSFASWLDHLTRPIRPVDNPSEIPGLINEDGSVDMINVEQIGMIHDIPRPLDKCDVIRLWSHGAAFDPPILAAAYAAVGLPVPWHYRAPRDTRTAFDMAGITDHSAWLAQTPGPLGVSHHALDDAICQARAVCAAMARVGSVSDDQFDEIGTAMVNLSALMRRDGFFSNSHNHEAYERVVSLWENAIGHPNGKALRS